MQDETDALLAKSLAEEKLTRSNCAYRERNPALQERNRRQNELRCERPSESKPNPSECVSQDERWP